MANNQAQDRYNPQGVMADDWESHKFFDLPDGEIFFLKNEKNNDNHAYRKINDKQALNTRMQTTHDVLSNITVYTKI
jgi:hypothetical protein|tara:strand:+ start:185 stop:415 length:231 start_codon:yes stop_codon:yes gene_type:complete